MQNIVAIIKEWLSAWLLALIIVSSFPQVLMSQALQKNEKLWPALVDEYKNVNVTGVGRFTFQSELYGRRAKLKRYCVTYMRASVGESLTVVFDSTAKQILNENKIINPPQEKFLIHKDVVGVFLQDAVFHPSQQNSIIDLKFVTLDSTTICNKICRFFQYKIYTGEDTLKGGVWQSLKTNLPVRNDFYLLPARSKKNTYFEAQIEYQSKVDGALFYISKIIYSGGSRKWHSSYFYRGTIVVEPQ